MRILFIQATFVPPPVDTSTDRFFLLSEELEGDVLQPAWFRTPDEIEAIYGPGSYPVYTVGRFRYHWLLAFRYQGWRQRVETFRFYLGTARRIYRERRFDCIVAYSHMTTGVIGGIIKLLTGARLVVELVIAPETVYLTDRPRPSVKDRLWHLYSDVCLHLSMWLSDRAHLLYPGQLSHYRFLREKPSSVFLDYVPVSALVKKDHRGEESPYVLLAGAPWYRKGIDLLIAAFLRVGPEFPDVRLKILGHFPDMEEVRVLTQGSKQIEILKATPHAETLRTISGAIVMALPSRCEGLPRVLIEGMAAGLPILGSDVAGIPMLIEDGVNGFIVPNENVDVLASRLRELLADGDLRRRMGQKSYEMVHKTMSEKAYVSQFAGMVNAAVQERA